MPTPPLSLKEEKPGEKGSWQQGPGDPGLSMCSLSSLEWEKSRVPSVKEGQEWGQQEGLVVHRADAIPRT